MLALQLPGRITWSPDLVAASVALGIVFAGFALFVAARRHDWANMSFAAALLTLAIVALHFTAMGAVSFIPDPTRIDDAVALSPGALSLVIAGVAALILGMCLVAALSARHSQDKLRQQKYLLDTALENMSQGLCMFEADGRIRLFNQRYTNMVSMSAASLDGRSLLDVIKRRKESGEFAGDPEEFFKRVLAEVREGRSNTRIIEIGAGRSVRVTEQPMLGGGWVATLEDITKWREAQAQILHMARHDALTNLPNRTLFREQLDHALCRITRHEQVAVHCLDLDHFKDVNDSLGHPIGDGLLNEVARRLRECVRDSDTVSRLGGDEFAIVQAGGELHASDISSLASRLVEIVGAPYDIQGHQVIIGASIGISVAPDDGRDPD
jgi:diguanylate cyclase (GGDEF)-like protein/PAS domain S-box-containing protein